MLYRIGVLVWLLAALAMVSGVRAQSVDAAPGVPAAGGTQGMPAGAAAIESADATPAAEEMPAPEGADELPSGGEVERAAQSTRERARAAYADGEAAFKRGEYEAALDAFLRAYRALPNPVVLLSVAETERRLGRIDAAIAHLAAFLEAAPAADPRRVEVAAEIEELRRIPGTVVVSSDPAGATVRVEGRPEQVTAPGELLLPSGDYVLLVQMPGRRAVRSVITLQPGARKEAHVSLLPAPPPAAAVAPTDNTALWIAGGVGVAGLVTGSVLGFMALSENSDYDRNPTMASADRGERLSLFADVALGVGVMGLLTATVMYLTADADADPEPAETAQTGTFTLGIAPTRNGGFAQAAVRF